MPSLEPTPIIQSGHGRPLPKLPEKAPYKAPLRSPPVPRRDDLDVLPPPLPPRDPPESSVLSNASVTKEISFQEAESAQKATSNGRAWMVANGSALGATLALAVLISTVALVIILAPPGLGAIMVIAGAVVIGTALAAVALTTLGLLSYGIHLNNKEKEKAPEKEVTPTVKPIEVKEAPKEVSTAPNVPPPPANIPPPPPVNGNPKVTKATNDKTTSPKNSPLNLEEELNKKKSQLQSAKTPKTFKKMAPPKEPTFMDVVGTAMKMHRKDLREDVSNDDDDDDSDWDEVN